MHSETREGIENEILEVLSKGTAAILASPVQMRAYAHSGLIPVTLAPDLRKEAEQRIEALVQEVRECLRDREYARGISCIEANKPFFHQEAVHESLEADSFGNTLGSVLMNLEALFAMQEREKVLTRMLEKSARQIMLGPWEERGIRAYDRLPPRPYGQLAGAVMSLKCQMKADLAQGMRQEAKERLEETVQAWKDPGSSPYFIGTKISAELDGISQWSAVILLSL